MTRSADAPPPEGTQALSGLVFGLLRERFAVHQLPPDAPVDLAPLRDAAWYSITRTQDELSIVAPEGVRLGASRVEPGWSCLQIEGPLDFGMVGVIAGVSRILADAGVSIFAISTYDTDCFLVKSESLETAASALASAGGVVRRT